MGCPLEQGKIAMKSWMIAFVSVVTFVAAPTVFAQKQAPAPKVPVETTGKNKDKEKSTPQPKASSSKALDAAEAAEAYRGSY